MNDLYAAIDLGSNNMKLKIVQYVDKKITVLENLSKPIGIGDGVFTLGYIEHERVKDISEALLMFKEIMMSYGVKRWKAVATNAMRVAQNGLNVIEVLEKNTGIKVEIIEDTVEKHLTYMSIRDNMKDYKAIRQSGIIVELNTGGCDVSLYGQNALVFNEEFMLGSLVLKNIMHEIETKNIHYPRVVDELIHARTNHIWHNIQVKKIKHFLAIGGEARLMKKYIFDNREKVSRKEFNRLYDKIINDPRALRKELESFDMDWYEVISSILVYHTFFELVNTEYILFPEITLRDGLIAQLIEKDHDLKRYQLFQNDTISLARSLAKKYRSSIPHCKMVEKNGLVIFEALSQAFLFEEVDEQLLKLSVILHEIGKFTRMKAYYTATFEKIRNMNIMGMTARQMLIVAYICRFMNYYDVYLNEIVGLTEKEHNLVIKMASILSLADALDKSKTQKITIEKVLVMDEELQIHIEAKKDVTLELWEFERRKKYFVNTFGMIPRIIENRSRYVF